MKILSLIVVLTMFSAGVLPAWTPEGKKKTGRAISIEAIVKAPRQRVFDLWITENGAKKFIGLNANIQPHIGGDYTIFFDPDDERLSSKGAKLLRIDRPNFLAFEWKGTPDMIDMNQLPLSTWVELEFIPAENNQTHLKFNHYGFGEGGTWDNSVEFFTRSWNLVIDRLKDLCEKGC
jgi:uncharacterized protein YndB with AHSA1/START domain